MADTPKRGKMLCRLGRHRVVKKGGMAGVGNIVAHTAMNGHRKMHAIRVCARPGCTWSKSV